MSDPRPQFQPRISAVIPAYNRAAVIIRAINSALDQTYAPIEVIVVDDFSKDGTAEVADALGDARVKVLRSERNGGGGVARNIGIDASKGDYIALLDSDDVWYRNKLERQIELLSAVQNRERAICYTNLNHMGPRRNRTWNKRLYNAGSDLSDYLIVERQAIQTSTIVMSANLAREIRFDERLRCHQDWDFVLRANAAGASFIGTLETLVDYEAKQPIGRVSEQRMATHRRLWQQLAKSLLSERANATFYASEVFPRLGASEVSLAAWSELLSGALPGRASPGLVLGEAMKRLLPKGLVEQLRRAKRDLSSRRTA